MIRKTMFAFATVAAIAAAALIPTEASAGGGGKGGGMGGHHGHWGHGYGGGFGGIVVIGPSCWRWVPGLGRVYVCSTCRGPGLATRDRGHPFAKRANDTQLASSQRKVPHETQLKPFLPSTKPYSVNPSLSAADQGGRMAEKEQQ